MNREVALGGGFIYPRINENPARTAGSRCVMHRWSLILRRLPSDHGYCSFRVLSTTSTSGGRAGGAATAGRSWP
jgi:hypothetical protein